MTEQEIFNKVYKHLLSQNAISERQGKTKRTGMYCAYRGENGTKCSIGSLINDDEYVPEMEEKNVTEMLEIAPSTLKDRLTPHLKLLKRLQGIHDNSGPVFWPRYLQEISEEFQLTIPETH